MSVTLGTGKRARSYLLDRSAPLPSNIRKVDSSERLLIYTENAVHPELRCPFSFSGTLHRRIAPISSSDNRGVKFAARLRSLVHAGAISDLFLRFTSPDTHLGLVSMVPPIVPGIWVRWSRYVWKQYPGRRDAELPSWSKQRGAIAIYRLIQLLAVCPTVRRSARVMCMYIPYVRVRYGEWRPSKPASSSSKGPFN